MLMHNPPHPGKIINELCLKPLSLTITSASKGLGVSRKTLSEIINGHSGISVEMAIRLSFAFGGDPNSWIMQQVQYDLWRARKNVKKDQVTSFLKAS